MGRPRSRAMNLASPIAAPPPAATRPSAPAAAARPASATAFGTCTTACACSPAARAPRISISRAPSRAPLPGVAITSARSMPSRAASSATRATAPGANTTRWDGMSWVKEATMRCALALRSELGADLAIERIGPAAAQRNGETDEAPEQRVFVAAVEPSKTVLPVEHGDDQHLDRRGRGEKAGEQAENER